MGRRWRSRESTRSPAGASQNGCRRRATAGDLRPLPPPVTRRQREPGAPAVNVVVKTADGGAVSLVVDEIGDVLEPSRDAFEVPPDTVPASIRALVTRVCKLDGSLMLLLDAARAVEVSAA